MPFPSSANRCFGEDHIVTQAAGDAPQLQCIQYPGAQFWVDEDIFVTGFIVLEDKWRERTVDVAAVR